MKLHHIVLLVVAVIAALAFFGCTGDQQAIPGGSISSGGIGAPGGTEVTEVGEQEVVDDDGVIEDPEETQVGPTKVEITTSKLGTAVAGKSYKKFLHAQGGSCGKKQCTYNWELQGLPDGLSLTGCSKDPAPQITGSKACIQGTPAAEGSFDVSILATDKDDQTLFASKTLTLVVNPKPAEPQPQIEFLTPGAFIETVGSSTKPELKVILDAPKPDKEGPKVSGSIPEINVQGNVDLSTPLFLRFHAEGGCGGYMWPAGIYHYPRPATNMWSYTAEQCSDKAPGGLGPKYCEKITKIKPYLSDWNLDPIHTIEAIVEDSCGNVAKQLIRLAYRYPPDKISAKHPDGVLNFCMRVQHTNHWGDNGRQLNFWVTGSPEGCLDNPDAIHSGQCDVASLLIQAFDNLQTVYDNVPVAMKTGPLESIISDAPEFTGNYYTHWISIGGTRGCDMSRYYCPENMPGFMEFDQVNPNVDIVSIRVASKHWYMISYDDAFGDLINNDEEPGDRDLTYSIMARNKNGGIWLRRPIGFNETNVCGTPDHLLGGGEELIDYTMQEQAAPAVDSEHMQPMEP